MKNIDGKSLPKIPDRVPDSHKGSYGRISLFGGSLGMAGAMTLASRAALKAGAGLVQAVVPERIMDIISVKLTSCTVMALPSDAEGMFSPGAKPHIPNAAEDSDVCAAGPGMGTSDGSRDVVRGLMQLNMPLIIDADGLNCLAVELEPLLRERKGATIVTPHPGEMGRLCRMTVAEVQANREETAVKYASENCCIVVLKGNKTVVTDGENLYVNENGNPGMATGGSGDVLTGVIAGVLGSAGLGSFEAACVGVWIHGAAGDLAASEIGQIGMTAEDILENVPGAFRKYKSKK